MNPSIVICDHEFTDASFVPSVCLGAPGRCPPGVYDTMLWENGSLANFKLHVDRFLKACSHMGIDTGNVDGMICSAENLESLLKKNGLEAVRARVRVAGFSEKLALRGGTVADFQFLTAAWPASMDGLQPSRVRCGLSQKVRSAGDKSYNYKLLGRRHVDEELFGARQQGVADILFQNDCGEFCEASYSNLWVLKGGRLQTPPLGSPCLPGTLRLEVAVRAREMGLEVEMDRPLVAKDLQQADEIFLTSSIRVIQSVGEIVGLREAPVIGESSILRDLRVIVAS